jgi:hypothetical protein
MADEACLPRRCLAIDVLLSRALAPAGMFTESLPSSGFISHNIVYTCIHIYIYFFQMHNALLHQSSLLRDEFMFISFSLKCILLLVFQLPTSSIGNFHDYHSSEGQ